MAISASFYEKFVPNPSRSKAEGRPAFDAVEMCDVQIAGDKMTNPHFPAHEVAVSYDHKQRADDTRTWAERFPDEYRAFKTGDTKSPASVFAAENVELRDKLSALEAMVAEQKKTKAA